MLPTEGRVWVKAGILYILNVVSATTESRSFK